MRKLKFKGIRSLSKVTQHGDTLLEAALKPSPNRKVQKTFPYPVLLYHLPQAPRCPEPSGST